MKFLKGCAATILCLTILLLTGTAFSIFALQATVLNSEVIADLIDKADFQKIIPTLMEQVDTESSEPVEPGAMDMSTIKDVVENLEEEDFDLIKETAKEGIVKFYDFLNGKTEDFTFEISLSKFAPIITDFMLSSPEMMEQLGLPFEICKNGNTKDCVTEKQVTDLLGKGLAGTLDADDLLTLFPICPDGYVPPSSDGMPECIPADIPDELRKEINATLAESGLNTESANQESGQAKAVPGTITLSSESFPQGLWDVRDILSSYVKPAPYVLLGIAFILILFVFLIQKVNGFIWIGIISVLQGLLLASGKATTQLVRSVILSQIQVRVPTIDTTILNGVVDFLMHFVNAYNNFMAIYGLIMIGVGALLIFAWSIFRKKKEEVVVKDVGVDKTPEHLPKEAQQASASSQTQAPQQL